MNGYCNYSSCILDTKNEYPKAVSNGYIFFRINKVLSFYLDVLATQMTGVVEIKYI